MKKPTFEQCKPEYQHFWNTMTITNPNPVRETAHKIALNRARYMAVEAKTGVPWAIIGVLHAMECGLNFRCHLHNGDPLSARTTHVPAGRPQFAPTGAMGAYTWEESAADALQIDGTDKVKDWSVERVAYELETYNGFGSRAHGVPSAYLWSYSNHYGRGKYVADGVWDGEAVSKQSGGMPILKVLLADYDASFGSAKLPTVEQPKPITRSKIAGAATAVATAGAATTGADVLDTLDQITDIKEHLDTLGLWDKIIGLLSINKFAILGVLLIVIAGMIIYWRWKDHGKDAQ